MIRVRLKILTCALVALTIPATGWATNGYFTHGTSVAEKGLAGAGVAFSQDTLAAANNPAGMVWQGASYDIGAALFAPDRTSYEALLRIFWESHNSTQGMRQGNDAGTQYRSGVYGYTQSQCDAAEASRAAYQRELHAAGFGDITTEILEAPEFYFAEDYHQQYLAKNPGGYCGIGGTGVSCPIGQ